MKLTITESGARQISQRLEDFPAELHQKLAQRISGAIEELHSAVLRAVPHRTGRLASEIVERVFSDAKYRVAGYVSVYTDDPGPAPHNEYAKAATLEYGSSRSRAIRDEEHGVLTRLRGSSRRIKARMSKPVDIAARRYLRGPLDALRPEILAMIEEAVAEAAGAANGGASA